MTITKTRQGKTLTIVPEGRLDTNSAPELERELQSSRDGVEELILDFKNLEYISSAGLRVLLSAHKAMYGKGTMKILNSNEIVKEVFEVTGFFDVLNIE